MADEQKSYVQELRARIARCRRGRHVRARLPEALWLEATSVAKQVGAYGASRALGVSYESLRSRLASGASSVGPRKAEAFVELSGAQLFGTGMPGGTVIEMVGPDGTRLTIRVGSSERVDVAALVQVFRGRQ